MTKIDMARQHGHNMEVEFKDSKEAFNIGYKSFLAGYTKANEWHYAKDELPPEDVPLLLVSGGKIYVAWYWDNVYHDSRCCQVKKPYAWQEIVLPEIIK